MAAPMKRNTIVDALVAGLAAIRRADGYFHDITTAQVTRRAIVMEKMDSAKLPMVSVSIVREYKNDKPGYPQPMGGDSQYNDLELDVAVYSKATDPAMLDLQIERAICDVRQMIAILGGTGCNAIHYEIAEIVSSAQIEGRPEWGAGLLRVVYTYELNPKNP